MRYGQNRDTTTSVFFFGLFLIGQIILGCSKNPSSAASPTALPTSTPLELYEADLATIASRQSNHKFPKLANDTECEWVGDSSNGYLCQNLFSRLHWFDYVVVDGNNAVANSLSSLSSYLGRTGSIRSLNSNSVIVAYMSAADFQGDPNTICYQPLLTEFAFGPSFSTATCSDANASEAFNQSKGLYHDVSGNPIKLWANGNGTFSTLFDPGSSEMQNRMVNVLNTYVVGSELVDGVYYDWGGCSLIPNLGYTTTVSLSNNGVNNLVNMNDPNDPVNVEWQNGLKALYNLSRSTFPTNFIVAGNSGWGGQPVLFTSELQGTQLEQFNDCVASPYCGWQQAMSTYAIWSKNGKTPNFPFIQSVIDIGSNPVDANHLLYDQMVSTSDTWITESQFQELRFGLASALMFDGYFATANSGAYQAAFWLDEYAVDSNGNSVVPTDAAANSARANKGWLGTPLAEAYNVTNPSQTLWSVLQAGLSNNANTMVWRRDFSNGIVIVNPTTSSQTINLGGSFSKIHGKVDPAFNDGSTGISNVILPSQSGVVLRK